MRRWYFARSCQNFKPTRMRWKWYCIRIMAKGEIKYDKGESTAFENRSDWGNEICGENGHSKPSICTLTSRNHVKANKDQCR